MSQEPCEICVKPFTIVKRRQVICPRNACSKIACMECTQTYLSSDTVEKPCCMFCKEEYEESWVEKSFPVSFINGALKNKYVKTLFANELSQVQATQTLVPYLKKNDDDRASIFDIHMKMDDLRSEIRMLNHDIMQLGHETQSIERTIEVRNNHVYKGTYLPMYLRIDDGSNNTASGSSSGNQLRQIYPENFKIKCPTDECRGFLDNNFHCTICECTYCDNCLKPKQDEHTCIDDDKKVFDVIKQTSKPCPRCGIFIMREMGCPEMWCTNCNVGFDWSTGEFIRKKNLDNPHFNEWKRTQSVTLLPTVPFIQLELTPLNDNMYKERVEFFNRLYVNVQRFVTQLEHSLESFIDSYQFQVPVDNDPYRSLRISYIMKRISEDEFKRRLYQQDKKLTVIRGMIDASQEVYDEAVKAYRDIIANQVQPLIAIMLNSQFPYINKVDAFYERMAPHVHRFNDRMNQLNAIHRKECKSWISFRHITQLKVRRNELFGHKTQNIINRYGLKWCNRYAYDNNCSCSKCMIQNHGSHSIYLKQ